MADSAGALRDGAGAHGASGILSLWAVSRSIMSAAGRAGGQGQRQKGRKIGRGGGHTDELDEHIYVDLLLSDLSSSHPSGHTIDFLHSVAPLRSV